MPRYGGSRSCFYKESMQQAEHLPTKVQPSTKRYGGSRSFFYGQDPLGPPVVAAPHIPEMVAPTPAPVAEVADVEVVVQPVQITVIEDFTQPKEILNIGTEVETLPEGINLPVELEPVIPPTPDPLPIIEPEPTPDIEEDFDHIKILFERPKHPEEHEDRRRKKGKQQYRQFDEEVSNG